MSVLYKKANAIPKPYTNQNDEQTLVVEWIIWEHHTIKNFKSTLETTKNTFQDETPGK